MQKVTLCSVLLLACMNSDLSTVMRQSTPAPLNANEKAACIPVSFLEGSNWSDMSRQSISSQCHTSVRSRDVTCYSTGEIICASICIRCIELCIKFFSAGIAFESILTAQDLLVFICFIFACPCYKTYFDDALWFSLLLYGLVDMDVCQIRKEKRTANQNIISKTEWVPRDLAIKKTIYCWYEPITFNIASSRS